MLGLPLLLTVIAAIIASFLTTTSFFKKKLDTVPFLKNVAFKSQILFLGLFVFLASPAVYLQYSQANTPVVKGANLPSLPVGGESETATLVPRQTAKFFEGDILISAKVVKIQDGNGWVHATIGSVGQDSTGFSFGSVGDSILYKTEQLTYDIRITEIQPGGFLGLSSTATFMVTRMPQ